MTKTARSLLAVLTATAASPALASITQQVPEPSTLSMLGGLALLGVVLHRLSKRK